jgi:hypothetical protein
MEKRPIKRKTSDLSKGIPKRSSGKPWKYTTPASLALDLGCSQRTVRQYCKSGLIPEAYRTHGGHWRILLPYSVKTRLRLLKLQGDWPSGGREAEGEIESDWAEMLVLAQLCGMGLDEFIAAPFLPGVIEPPQDECVSIAHNSNQIDEPIRQDPDEMKKREAANRIRSLIWERLRSGASFDDLIIIGLVYQVWLTNISRRPTITEIARLMGISRGTFYRHGHTNQEIACAYLAASNESRRDLPDPDGLDPVQRANIRARRPAYTSSNYDPFDD